MRYFIASNVAIDKIYLDDGTETEYLPGGAGLHALSGIQLWTDDVSISCGVGEDFEEKLGPFFRENGIDATHLEVRAEKTPLNKCTYPKDGERIDETIYGVEHYIAQDCHAGDIERFFESDRADAVYTFRDDEPEHWECLRRMKEKYGFILQWEINAGICRPEKLERIKEILSFTDVFSINRKEAFELFGVDTEEKAIEELQALGQKMILFRTGAKGLYVLMDGKHKFFPSVVRDQKDVLDVTGCGNSSTSSSFWAFCEGYDIDGVGNAANIASSLCLKEWSVMSLGEDKRRKAYELLDELGAGKR